MKRIELKPRNVTQAEPPTGSIQPVVNALPESFDAFRGKRVLVLGASGFIGRWVAKLLTASGADLVLQVRDLETAKPTFGQWQIQGDVRAVDFMVPNSGVELLTSVKPAVLFNLAGYGVDRREREDKPFWRINNDLVRELAVAFAEQRDASWQGVGFVHAGTAAEYGAAKGNLDETSECKPTAQYGRSKLLGALELSLRSELAGYRAVIARLFTVYGPGELPGRLLPSLIESIAKRESIELTGGLQKRDFTYVEDAAEGLLRLALANPPESEIVNLATGKLSTVRAFAMSAAAVLGVPIDQLRFGALPTAKDEMEHGEVTIARLERLTRWKPPTSIGEGVAKTLAHERRAH